MMKKYFLLCFLFMATPLFAQTTQEGYRAIRQSYGTDTYEYTFSVNDGVVKWTYNGPNGNMSDEFYCDSYVRADIVLSECEGIVYWYFAGNFFWTMAEINNEYDATLFKWAKEALEKSLRCFNKASQSSPEAYERVLNNYDFLMKQEASLWETICTLSYTLNENPLYVEDLYNYNF